MSWNGIEKELVGKTITNINVTEGGGSIEIQTRKSLFVGKSYGDCCSTTWIENVEQPGIFPLTVLEVRDIDLPQKDQPEDEYTYIQYYGFEIVTNKGSITIDFRNESNGYYGGWLEWSKQ